MMWHSLQEILQIYKIYKNKDETKIKMGVFMGSAFSVLFMYTLPEPIPSSSIFVITTLGSLTAFMTTPLAFNVSELLISSFKVSLKDPEPIELLTASTVFAFEDLIVATITVPVLLLATVLSIKDKPTEELGTPTDVANTSVNSVFKVSKFDSVTPATAIRVDTVYG